MKDSFRWGFDIDSVVGDLSEVLERVAREVYGISVSRAQFTAFRLEECLPYEPEFIAAWISRALEPCWTAQMRPYPGATDVLTELARYGPLRFVTARAEARDIHKWLASQLDRVPPDQIQVYAVGPSGSKAQVLKEWGVSHFVEDRLETCELLQKNGIVPIVFRQPWNERTHRFISVRCWREIRRWIQNGIQEVIHAQIPFEEKGGQPSEPETS